MKTLVFVILALSSVFASAQTLLKNLCENNVVVGNGFSVHPNGKLILVSKPSGKKDLYGKSQYSLYKLNFNGDTLEYVPLNINSEYSDYHPVIAPNGEFILFNSTRPKTNVEGEKGLTDIWMAKIGPDFEFSNAINVEKVNSIYHDSYPSLTNNGKLYFISNRPGGFKEADVYVANWHNNKWESPKFVSELSSDLAENDLFVDPQERFMLLNRYDARTNEIDLLISYKGQDNWTPPQRIGSLNNENVWELTPSISPNGELLFLELNGRLECFETKSFLKS